MKYSSVIGLQFGDEGKGSMTSYLCSKSKNPLVIRFNGGHQAGHSVLHKGIRHIFSSFGSGTLQNVPTFWSKYCTLYPTAVFNEYLALQSIDINKPILYVDPLCPITTPYDCVANQYIESINGHGSVGVGFGATIKRQESYYKLYFQDIFNRTVLEAKLKNIYHYYELIEKISMPHDIKLKVETWLKCIDKLIEDDILSESKMGFDKTYDKYIVNHYDHVIFEGAQGILLDMHYGFFPNVTRSNTTNKNVLSLIKDLNLPFNSFNNHLDTYYMTRCYQTRHGYGFMSNEEHGNINLINNENEINVDSGFQGKFRKSILDIDLIKYAIQCDSHNNGIINNKYIAITCLDQLKDLNNISFTLNKESIKENLQNLTTIIKENTGVKNVIHGTSEGVFEENIKYDS